ncbi:hypothetical protein ACFY4H_28460 [Streptomyces althioticus]|uniref:hypothetical protein n=1 Tax=Streptomyces althioticus TaxID=83380 RepID=UPI0036C6850F
MASKADFEWLESRPEWVKNVYRLKVEVEYRRTSGTSFQHLFDRVMRSIHGDDYSTTATYGNQGDLGCDGILRSRRVHFAVYAPSPYFKISEARRKMRADFSRMLECWEIGRQVKQWTFVINYPGVHPSLTSYAQELEDSNPGLKVTVWSRFDLTQQLLAYARMDLLRSEFGAVEDEARRLVPLTFVPEDTALPSDEAVLAYKRYRARITCDRDEFEHLTEQWLGRLGENPIRWLLVHNQFLIGAMAAAIMADAYSIAEPPMERLQYALRLHDSAWGEEFETAWGTAAAMIFQEDYPHEFQKIGEDSERVLKICMLQEALTLGAIRVHSSITGEWENEILEEVWSYVTDIKIHGE